MTADEHGCFGACTSTPTMAKGRAMKGYRRSSPALHVLCRHRRGARLFARPQPGPSWRGTGKTLHLQTNPSCRPVPAASGCTRHCHSAAHLGHLGEEGRHVGPRQPRLGRPVLHSTTAAGHLQERKGRETLSERRPGRGCLPRAAQHTQRKRAQPQPPSGSV